METDSKPFYNFKLILIPLRSFHIFIERVDLNFEGIKISLIKFFYKDIDFILFRNFCLQETDDKIHVVIGNESCDLDSVVAALTYGYFLHKVTLSIYTNNETLH